MPRQKTSDPRSQQLNVALTRGEFVKVQSRADGAGLRLVDYARAALLGEMIVTGLALTQSRFDCLTVEAWKRVGNNLNQVARQLNALQRVEAQDVEIVLTDIRRLIVEAARDGA